MRDPAAVLRPRPLVAGDRVALVAPASRFDAAAMHRGAAVLEGWGLVVETPPTRGGARNFAGTDAERAAELSEVFARDDVAAVMAVRGGYGAARLHGRFDAARAAAQPKIFLGYSDLTILLSRLWQEAGLVCFHGPMASSDLARLGADELEPLRRFLFGEDGWWKGQGLVGRRAGSASGRLVGGCLSMLATTIGTPYEVETRDGVLFLEDISEKPYRIDRMLTHLLHARKLDDVAAVVLGTFHDCDEANRPGEVLEVMDEILGRLGIPVVSGFDAGHYSRGGVLPIGAKVRVDGDAGAVELLEPVLAAGRAPVSLGDRARVAAAALRRGPGGMAR